MAINSKNKGNTHERNVAKMLSDWAGAKFMRTPMSGAIHNFHDKRVVSDIVAPLSIGEWPFSIECKNTENSWEINTFVEGTAEFWKQWKQCLDDSIREDLCPMLVFTKNYRDIYMAIKIEDFNLLKINIESYIEIHKDDQHLVVFQFKYFLKSTSVEEVIKNLKK